MWTSLVDRGITILLTGSVLAFFEFLIKRHDEKKDKKEGIGATLDSIKGSLEALKTDVDKKFRKAEKDGLRTQLLVLITMRPNEQQEILTISEITIIIIICISEKITARLYLLFMIMTVQWV